MIKTIIALENDGRHVRAMAINFEIPSVDFPLHNAVKEAATEFCQTEEGRKVYRYNACHFNWGDFVSNVPGSFCEKHGFKMLASQINDEVVDWNEELADWYELCGEDEDV